MVQYSLKFTNQSSLSGQLSLYMRQADQDSNIFSVGRSSAICMPGVTATVSWNDTFCLVWGEPGTLHQGSIFSPRQVLQVSPGDTLGLEGDASACSFVRKGQVVAPDSFGIKVGSGIPNHTYSIGLGMGDWAALVCEAGPNLLYTFPATGLAYWAIFGNFKDGWLFDPRYFMDTTKNSLKAFSTSPIPLVFPPNIFSLNVVLGNDNILKIAEQ